MKMRLQWKDPDFCDARSGESPYHSFDRDDDEASDALYTQLRALGIGEYIVIEVDTDAGTAVVVK